MAAEQGVLKSLSSVLMDRFRWMQQAGITFRGARDMYQILGYKRTLSFYDFYDRYRRGGIAKNIVEAFPLATWRGGVEVFEDSDPDTNTAFEQGWKDLEDRLNVWAIFQQLDILAGLSTYAVLLIGTSGNSDLTTELPKGGKVIFLKPFSGGGGPGFNRPMQTAAFDAAARVATYDTDPTSERFGEPLTYWIKQATINAPIFNREVHWSRLIHAAEGCLEDSIFGIPTLENVWNLLDDLDKITGGGAEAHFLRANQGLHLDIDKDMGLAPAPGQPVTPGLSPTDVANLRDKAEELQHQLQRVMVTRGVTATQLGSDVANFGSNADAVLKQIAGSKGIPVRILTGSERGELASSMDAQNFDSRVMDRRTGYAGPMIVRKLVDRLIAYEYLPQPQSYEIGWPVEENMDEKGKADFALSLANTNKTYGATIFDDVEIRDMAFDKKPLPEKQPWENLTELDKATLATKLAQVNKEMGITVYTDDEIRMMSHGLSPLSDAEKVPIGAPEKVSVTQPPKIGEDGLPLPQDGQAVPVAQPLKTMLAALESAIENSDIDAIDKILGVTS
jgi:hypothetical protein